MTKPEKIRLCDRTLIVMSVLSLASAIQLEASGSQSVTAVWIHAAVNLTLSIIIIMHIYLHFGWKSWIERFRKLKSRPTKWLAIIALLTFVSGFAAFIHWTATYKHSPFGGVHGKIGFLFLIFATWHTIKRLKFLKPRKNSVKA